MNFKKIADFIFGLLVKLYLHYSALKKRRRQFRIILDGDLYAVKERSVLLWRNVYEKRIYLIHSIPTVSSTPVRHKTPEEALDWLRQRYGQKAKIVSNP